MTDTHVRLIAPSGYPHNRDAMARGVARLQDVGCEVSGLDVLDRIELRYAGSDAERAADINALATMESLPDITLAVRGGYGATRLLPYLNYDALRERLGGSDAVLVGHSDFTAIQMALYAQSGVVTFGGPMLGPDFGAEELNDFTQTHFWNTVRAPARRQRGQRPGPRTSTCKDHSGAAILRCCAVSSVRRISPPSMAVFCTSRMSASRRTGSSGCCTNCIFQAFLAGSAHCCSATSPSADPAGTTTATTSNRALPSFAVW